MRLSGLLGLITYVLILFPVLISSLNALQLAAITEPASDMLGTILDVIPSLFAAVLLVSVAYLVGRLVSRLISNVLAGAGFDNILAQLGLGQPAEGGRTPSAVIGTLILVAILLFASVEAASLLGFVNLAEMLSGFITLGGQVIHGTVVFGIGLLSGQPGRHDRASQRQRAGIPPGERRPRGDHRPDRRHGPATDGLGERDHQSRLRRPARRHRRRGRVGFRPRRARRRVPGGRALDQQAGGPTVEDERGRPGAAEALPLSIRKACELVDVTRRTIYSWMASGKVETIRTAGGSVRIFVDTLWRTPDDPAIVGWDNGAAGTAPPDPGSPHTPCHSMPSIRMTRCLATMSTLAVAESLLRLQW